MSKPIVDIGRSQPDTTKLTITRRSLLQTATAAFALGTASPLRLFASPVRTSETAAIALSAPCLAPSRTSYPPLLQRFIDKLDPSKDIFPTEVFVVELERVLAKWGSDLCASANSTQALASITADSIAASSRRPSTSKPLRSTGPLRIEHRGFLPPTTHTRAAFLQEWKESLASFRTIETAAFEIYGLRIITESPLRIEAEVHYDLLGTARDGTREQRNGDWTIEWLRSGPAGWLATRWANGAEMRASLTGPGFVETTSEVLSPHTDAAAQLAAGIDAYRATLDAAIGIDVYGNHGIAVGDIDGNGFDSIYVCQPAGLPNRLLRNRGDGTLEDITALSGTGLLDGTASAIFADFQNRGMQDLLVVRSGGPVLFQNMGGGRFQVREEAFRFARPPQGTFTSAAVADYNRDSLVDVYFCLYSYYQGMNQYQFPSPYYDAQNGPPNFLFRNRGDGTFEDVTIPSGMDTNNNRFSFAAEWCDYDNDGWPDLYVANDFGRKNLYRNGRNGTFSDVAASAGVEDYGPGMSTCWLDYDNDGKQDLYVANMWLREGKRITANGNFLPDVPETTRALYRKHNAGNSMYRNNGNGAFEDRTLAAGTERGGWSWSCASWDFEQDGWPDLYVANGFVSGPDRFDLQSFFWRQVAQRSAEAPGVSTEYEMAWNAVNELVRSGYSWSGYQRNCFYANNRDGTFSDVSGLLGLDLVDDSRAIALTDLDGDGRLEFVLKNRTAPQIRVLRNLLQTEGNAIAVRLTGRTSNRDAIGAVVIIESQGGKQTKQLSAGSGFASQHTKTLFFGLGEATAPIAVTVRWPSGNIDRYNNVAVNQLVSFEEGKADPVTRPFVRRILAKAGGKKAELSAAPQPSGSWLASPLIGPDLKLTASDGTLHTLSDLRGKPALLLFLDLSCGQSSAQLAAFEQERERTAAASLSVYAVAVEQDASLPVRHSPLRLLRASREQLSAWNIQHRYLFDRREDLSFPTSFLLDESGSAVRIYQGPVDPALVIVDAKQIPTTAQSRLEKALPYPGVYLGNPVTRDYFSYAIAFVEYGLLDEAENALQQAISQNPQYAAAWFNLGTVYLNKKRYPEAQKALREAVRLNPQDSDAWNNLGMIAGESGDYAEALDDFRNSARANPSHLTAVQNMMQIYQYQSRPADAQQAMQELIVKAPGSADLHLGLAMALLGQGDTVGGKQELQTAIELRPNFADARNNLGTVLLQAGDTDGALREFERCRQIAPDFDRPVLNEAVLFNRTGKRDEARRVLEAFLSTHPDNADVRAMLQKLGTQ